MGSNKPVLVVDDEDTLLELVRQILEDDGYRVAVARDGAEALKLLARLEPCLILLDMRMPSMNGAEFYQAYKQRFSKRAPIVVMTAGRDEEMATVAGVNGLLRKPFAIDDLVVTVRQYIPDTSR